MEYSVKTSIEYSIHFLLNIFCIADICVRINPTEYSINILLTFC